MVTGCLLSGWGGSGGGARRAAAAAVGVGSPAGRAGAGAEGRRRGGGPRVRSRARQAHNLLWANRDDFQRASLRGCPSPARWRTKLRPRIFAPPHNVPPVPASSPGGIPFDGRRPARPMNPCNPGARGGCLPCHAPRGVLCRRREAWQELEQSGPLDLPAGRTAGRQVQLLDDTALDQVAPRSARRRSAHWALSPTPLSTPAAATSAEHLAAPSPTWPLSRLCGLSPQ
jgi:hypothetical protein